MDCIVIESLKGKAIDTLQKKQRKVVIIAKHNKVPLNQTKKNQHFPSSHLGFTKSPRALPPLPTPPPARLVSGCPGFNCPTPFYPGIRPK